MTLPSVSGVSQGSISAYGQNPQGNLLNAEIFFNGNPVGYGAVLYQGVAFGTYTVTCGPLTGYSAPTYSSSNTVTVTSSSPYATVVCTYQPVAAVPTTGTLTVNTVDQYGFPVGATVYLNGAPIGTGPLVNSAIQPGSYTVTCGAGVGTTTPSSVSGSPVNLAAGGSATVTCLYTVSYGSGGCNYYTPSTNTCSVTAPSPQKTGGAVFSSIFGTTAAAVGSEILTGVVLSLFGAIGLVLSAKRKPGL